MEDTLRGIKKSSGRRSKNRLNPCFNGRYSQSYIRLCLTLDKPVLILVLMEDTLRDFSAQSKTVYSEVLILVLMEDTLRELQARLQVARRVS